MSQHLGDRTAAYVDGVLDPAETSAVEAHLVQCPACQAQVAEQRRVRDVLRASGPSASGPPAELLAVLASMPVTGPPARTSPATVTLGRGVVVRRAAVSCVAAGATVLATAWMVGGPASAVAGPPAVPPANLLAQHSATAGQLPFWGASSEDAAALSTSSKAETSSKGEASGTAETSTKAKEKLTGATWALSPTDAMSRWVTRNPSAIMRRAARASSQLSYDAVEQVTTYDAGGAVTRVAEINHISGQGTSTRQLNASDPDGAFQRQVVGPASSSLDAVSLLERSYRVVGEGTDLVAGRAVDRIAVLSADGTLVARFWIDRVSGLPLARESQRNGRLSVINRMTAISVTDRTAMSVHLPVATSAVWGEAVGIPADQALEVLEGRGWICPTGLAKATGLQPFDVLVADGDASASEGPVLHIIYTDGLRSVSVFQQRAALSQERLSGFQPADVGGQSVYRKGDDPTELTWAADGMVFTVVGDVPTPVLDTVVLALPHDRTTLGTRTGRGLARVGSWIDPFG